MAAVRDHRRQSDIAVEIVDIKSSVARHAMLDVATRKLCMVNLDHALAAIFVTRWLLTKMIAGFVSTLTWLRALEHVVHGLGVTLRLTSLSTSKAVGASLHATSFRTESGEAFRLLSLNG